MKTPSFMLSLSILFWGWMTGHPYIAAVMAAIYEFTRFIKAKWNMTKSDYKHAVDLSFVIFISVLIYGFVTDKARTMVILIMWMPVVSFPLLLVQQFSNRGLFDYRTLFLLARKKDKGTDKSAFCDMCYPIAIICLTSAGSLKHENFLYYLFAVILIFWALFTIRSKRFPVWIWAVSSCLAVILGFVSHVGLNLLQQKITELTTELFMGDVDPFKGTTSIGEIGQQKQFNHIVFRAKADIKKYDSLLLREAGYNVYKSGSWYAINSPLKSVHKSSKSSWVLKGDVNSGEQIEIYSYLKNGSGMLKLPLGAYKIDQLPVEYLRKNHLGSAKAANGPELVKYKVSFDP